MRHKIYLQTPRFSKECVYKLQMSPWTWIYRSVQLFVHIFQNQLKSNLISKLGSNFDLNDDHAIANNLLKMDIFYKEFNFEDIAEVPAYPVCMSVWLLFLFFVFNPWDLYYQGYKKNNNNNDDDNDDDDVPAAAVHLRLGRCAWFVVRLRHHDLHRVHRVLHRPHRTHRQQTVSMLLATSRLNLAVLQCCCVSITVS